MELITRRKQAAAALEMWKKQYPDWRPSSFFDSRAVTAKLEALGPDPDPDAVDTAIGNKSWTTVRCNECSENKEELVQVGQPPDYESAIALLCVDCLRKALQLITQE